MRLYLESLDIFSFILNYFILNLLCVVIEHLIITHTITSLLPRLYLHKIRIENGIVLTFEKLMLSCMHMKNSHSTWSIRHVLLWPNWEPLSFRNFRINLTFKFCMHYTSVLQHAFTRIFLFNFIDWFFLLMLVQLSQLHNFF